MGLCVLKLAPTFLMLFWFIPIQLFRFLRKKKLTLQSRHHNHYITILSSPSLYSPDMTTTTSLFFLPPVCTVQTWQPLHHYSFFPQFVQSRHDNHYITILSSPSLYSPDITTTTSLFFLPPVCTVQTWQPLHHYSFFPPVCTVQTWQPLHHYSFFPPVCTVQTSQPQHHYSFFPQFVQSRHDNHYITILSSPQFVQSRHHNHYITILSSPQFVQSRHHNHNITILSSPSLYSPDMTTTTSLFFLPPVCTVQTSQPLHHYSFFPPVCTVQTWQPLHHYSFFPQFVQSRHHNHYITILSSPSLYSPDMTTTTSLFFLPPSLYSPDITTTTSLFFLPPVCTVQTSQPLHHYSFFPQFVQSRHHNHYITILSPPSLYSPDMTTTTSLFFLPPVCTVQTWQPLHHYSFFPQFVQSRHHNHYITILSSPSLYSPDITTTTSLFFLPPVCTVQTSQPLHHYSFFPPVCTVQTSQPLHHYSFFPQFVQSRHHNHYITILSSPSLYSPDMSTTTSLFFLPPVCTVQTSQPLHHYSFFPQFVQSRHDNHYITILSSPSLYSPDMTTTTSLFFLPPVCTVQTSQPLHHYSFFPQFVQSRHDNHYITILSFPQFVQSRHDNHYITILSSPQFVQSRHHNHNITILSSPSLYSPDMTTTTSLFFLPPSLYSPDITTTTSLFFLPPSLYSPDITTTTSLFFLPPVCTVQTWQPLHHYSFFPQFVQSRHHNHYITILSSPQFVQSRHDNHYITILSSPSLYSPDITTTTSLFFLPPVCTVQTWQPQHHYSFFPQFVQSRHHNHYITILSSPSLYSPDMTTTTSLFFLPPVCTVQTSQPQHHYSFLPPVCTVQTSQPLHHYSFFPQFVQSRHDNHYITILSSPSLYSPDITTTTSLFFLPPVCTVQTSQPLHHYSFFPQFVQSRHHNHYITILSSPSLYSPDITTTTSLFFLPPVCTVQTSQPLHHYSFFPQFVQSRHHNHYITILSSPSLYSPDITTTTSLFFLPPVCTVQTWRPQHHYSFFPQFVQSRHDNHYITILSSPSLYSPDMTTTTSLFFLPPVCTVQTWQPLHHYSFFPQFVQSRHHNHYITILSSPSLYSPDITTTTSLFFLPPVCKRKI